MPLYDYRCSACGVVHEHRQKISDDPIRECPDCGGEYKRIITSVGIIFKGSGFHINDYRDGKSGAAGKESATKSEASAEPSAQPSSETSEKPQSSADSGPSPSDQGKPAA